MTIRDWASLATTLIGALGWFLTWRQNRGGTMKCANCDKEADKECKYEDKLYCRLCASNLTHMYQLTEDMVNQGYIPCPVFDGKTNELIPFGQYPNIDYS